jgi:Schlafen, AlbA_2
MNRLEFLAVLDGGDFEALVDVREDIEVEFKRQPYQLDQESERFELAKDISALANADGGAIVLGVQTERREDAPIDVAVRIRPFAPDLVDTERYVATAIERIYPRIQGLRVEFKPRGDNAERGLVVIDVPPQAEADKLFLVQKPVDEGTTAPGWMVGVSVRSVGRVDERRVSEIHGLINRGYTVSDRLDDLVGEVGAIREGLDAGPVVAQETPADRLEALIGEHLPAVEQQLGELTPYLYLAAAPKAPTRVQSLTRQQGVRQTLESPVFTRHDGWNLVTLDRASIVGGRRLSLANGTRKFVDLYEDGTFVVVGTVPDFLAWHRRQLANKINALALFELTYNFLLVYDQILGDLEPLPEEVRVAIGLRHAHAYDEPLYMAYGRIDRIDYEADLKTRAAPDDAFDHSEDVAVTADEPHVDIGAAAYSLLVRLYNWFGFEDEAVPYTNEARTAIDGEQITNA